MLKTTPLTFEEIFLFSRQNTAFFILTHIELICSFPLTRAFSHLSPFYITARIKVGGLFVWFLVGWFLTFSSSTLDINTGKYSVSKLSTLNYKPKKPVYCFSSKKVTKDKHTASATQTDPSRVQVLSKFFI